MATTIVTKNSSTAAAVPTAAQLVQGELAVNVADKRLFTEDNAGAVVLLADGVKLDGIEALADVTDTANVTAAGALMDSELTSIASVKALDQGVATTDSPTFAAATVTGEITANGGIALGDNDKATFGASDDLEIYHDGSNSYISDTSGTGDLYLRGSNLRLTDNDGTLFLFGAANADTRLYYSGTAKIATTSTGIDVTGTATMDGLVVDGAGDGVKATIGKTGGTNLNIYADTNTVYLAGSPALSTAYIIDQTNNNMQFKVNAAERMRIDAGGSLLLGGTSKTSTPSLDNGVYLQSQTDGDVLGYSLYSNEGTHNRRVAFFLDDTNGVYGFDASASSGVPAFVIKRASVESMRIDSSGNVGIGTSSPDKLLDVSSNSAPTVRISNTRSDSNWDTDPVFGALEFYSSDVSGSGPSVRASVKAEATSAFGNATDLVFRNGDSQGVQQENLRINYLGRVGIGTSSPTYHLEVDAGSDPTINIVASDASRSRLFFSDSQTARGYINYDHATDDMLLATNGTERMRIDSSGNLLVGVSSPVGAGSQGVQLSGNGSVLTAKSSVDFRTHINFINPNGIVGTISTNGSATAYNTSSDQRLKENIADADDAGSKIDAIQVRQYDWKADGSHQDYGMIAQELQAVAPEAVSGDADSEEMMGVDYSKLVPMLIKEIQSLRNRVASLETGE